MQRVTYCLECGVPLIKDEDYGDGNPDCRYCCNCTDEGGNLIRKSRVQDGIKDFWSRRDDHTQARGSEVWSDSRFVSRMAHWRR